jgi:hypothetical protein
VAETTGTGARFDGPGATIGEQPAASKAKSAIEHSETRRNDFKIDSLGSALAQGNRASGLPKPLGVASIYF